MFSGAFRRQIRSGGCIYRDLWPTQEDVKVAYTKIRLATMVESRIGDPESAVERMKKLWDLWEADDEAHLLPSCWYQIPSRDIASMKRSRG